MISILQTVSSHHVSNSLQQYLRKGLSVPSVGHKKLPALPHTWIKYNLVLRKCSNKSIKLYSKINVTYATVTKYRPLFTLQSLTITSFYGYNFVLCKKYKKLKMWAFSVRTKTYFNSTRIHTLRRSRRKCGAEIITKTLASDVYRAII